MTDENTVSTDEADRTDPAIDGTIRHPSDGSRVESPRSGGAKGRVVVVALLGALGVLALLAGFVGLSGEENGSDFCDEVAALPSLDASAERDGSPAAGFTEFADTLDRVGDAAAADREVGQGVADAARELAQQQRELAEALAGSTSASDVVDAVAQAGATSTDEARATVSDAVNSRCY